LNQKFPAQVVFSGILITSHAFSHDRIILYGGVKCKASVDCAVLVCIAGEPALFTDKFRLALPVILVAVLTLRASATGVARIDRGNRNTNQPSFIFDK
jgi:hypothetical protein